MNHKDRKNRAEQTLNWTLPTTLLVEMDGALLDNRSVLYEAYCELLRKYGLEGSKTEFNDVMGLLPKELVLVLCDKYGLKNNLESLEQDYLLFLKKKYESGSHLSPDVVKTLSIAQQCDFTMALVSMLDRETTLNILRAHGVENIFDTVATAGEVPINESRSSNLYQHALSLVGADEEETLAVAFSQHAVEALREAGIHTLWIKHGVKENVPKHLFGSDKRCAQIKDWNNVQRCLQKWYKG